MKNTSILLLALFLVYAPAQAQTFNFTNPTFAPLHFNPAFAGSLDQGRLAMAHRRQWTAIPFNLHSSYGSWDQVSDRLHGAVGAEFNLESLGETNLNLQVSAIYAAKFNLGSNWTLSPALKVGYQGINKNMDKIERDEEVFLPRGIYNRQSLNFSPGVLINSPAFYFGVSSGFLGSLRLKETIEDSYTEVTRPERNWRFQSGYRFQPNGRPWSLAATVLVSVYAPFTEATGQLFYSRKWLLAGIGSGFSPRISGNWLSVAAGYKHQKFRLMLAYNYTTRMMTNSVTGGSWEASLMFYLPRKNSSSSPESSVLQ